MAMFEPTVRLGDLAHARSGDKGNTANVGVVARDQASFEWLRVQLTEAVVAAFFSPMQVGEVRLAIRAKFFEALAGFNASDALWRDADRRGGLCGDLWECGVEGPGAAGFRVSVSSLGVMGASDRRCPDSTCSLSQAVRPS